MVSRDKDLLIDEEEDVETETSVEILRDVVIENSLAVDESNEELATEDQRASADHDPVNTSPEPVQDQTTTSKEPAPPQSTAAATRPLKDSLYPAGPSPDRIVVEIPDGAGGYTVRNGNRALSQTLSIGFNTLEGSRFDSYSKVSLSWRDVSVTATLDGGGCFRRTESKTKDILKGVSGIVEPGQFMAIMGASGAGKTTLLNTLAFRNDHKLRWSGDICVNGSGISKSQLKLISAYVQQDDYFIGTLTVKEVLMFHANLRMDRKIADKEKEQKVKAIMKKLGLTKVKDSLCGLPDGSIRGISGGERKRLSVATELLMDPPLLFIDEPTSGLDSFMAESIVKLIRKLAQANRTILCTIHQPTSEVFALFDRVCLVAEGEIAFVGKSSAALELFSDVGQACPANFNPADHYIFTLAIRPGEEEKCRDKCRDIAGYYRRSEHFREVDERINQVTGKANKTTKEIRRNKVQASIWRQLAENMTRSWKNTVRNPGYTRSRIGQAFIIALLAGLTYYQTSNDIIGPHGLDTVTQNKCGVIFFIVISFTFGNVFIQCLTIPMELPVVKREYQNGMYGTIPYFLSKIMSEIPWLLGGPAIQLTICYFMIGLRTSLIHYLTALLCCVCIAWGSTGMGWFIAAWTGDIRIASAVASPIIMPFFLFGGLFQSDTTTPVYFEPIKYLSWMRYGYHMLMVNELKDLPLGCESGVSPCPNGTAILNRLSINPDELWWPNIYALLIFGGTFCFIAWSCLLCRVRR